MFGMISVSAAHYFWIFHSSHEFRVAAQGDYRMADRAMREWISQYTEKKRKVCSWRPMGQGTPRARARSRELKYTSYKQLLT